MLISPQETANIQSVCQANASYFNTALTIFDDEDPQKVAQALFGKGRGRYGFVTIAKALKDQHPTLDQVLRIQALCGKNSGLFAEAFEDIPHHPPEEIAAALGKAQIGCGFTNIARALKKILPTVGQILNIANLCKTHAMYFNDCMQDFPDHPPEEIAEALGNTTSGYAFESIAAALKESSPPPARILNILALCKNNGSEFADLYQILPDFSPEEIAEALGEASSGWEFVENMKVLKDKPLSKGQLSTCAQLMNRSTTSLKAICSTLPLLDAVQTCEMASKLNCSLEGYLNRLSMKGPFSYDESVCFVYLSASSTATRCLFNIYPDKSQLRKFLSGLNEVQLANLITLHELIPKPAVTQQDIKHWRNDVKPWLMLIESRLSKDLLNGIANVFKREPPYTTEEIVKGLREKVYTPEFAALSELMKYLERLQDCVRMVNSRESLRSAFPLLDDGQVCKIASELHCPVEQFFILTHIKGPVTEDEGHCIVDLCISPTATRCLFRMYPNKKQLRTFLSSLNHIQFTNLITLCNQFPQACEEEIKNVLFSCENEMQTDDVAHLADLNIPLELAGKILSCRHLLAQCIDFNTPYQDSFASSYIYSLEHAKNFQEFDFYLHCPKKISPLDDENDSPLWQHFVVRREDWNAFNYYGQLPQRAYGSLMHLTVAEGSEKIRANEWNFRTLLTFCAMRRHEMALLLHHRDAQSYGLAAHASPKIVFVSYCAQSYKDLGIFFYENHSPSNHYVIKDPLDIYYTCYNAFNGCKEKHAGQVLGTIGNSTVPLSSVLIYKFSEQGFLGNEQFFKKTGLPYAVSILHTDMRYIPIILDHVEMLYDLALNAESKEKRMNILGQLFWWICHAKFWAKGDPSIAELLVKSVLAAKDHAFPAWKVGIVPWVEVMKEPNVEQFAEEFHTLFE